MIVVSIERLWNSILTAEIPTPYFIPCRIVERNIESRDSNHSR